MRSPETNDAARQQTDRSLLDNASTQTPIAKPRLSVFISGLKPTTIGAFYTALVSLRQAMLVVLIGLAVNDVIPSFWQQAVALWLVMAFWTLHLSIENPNKLPIDRLQEVLGSLTTSCTVLLFLAEANCSSSSSLVYYRRLSWL